MKSAFQNISEMNTAFGNLFGCCVKEGKVTDYKKLMNQSKNLYDELDELKDDGFSLLSINKNDKEGRRGMLDAIGDILVFLYGVPHFLGVNYQTSVEEKNKFLEKINGYTENEKYEAIYDDIKSLIDDIIASISSEKELTVIENASEELDAYIHALCEHYNINLTILIDRITLSNMSKLCASIDEQELTLKKYRDDGVDVYAKESPLKQEDGKPYYVVYSSKEQEVKGKVYRAHKFLKCVKFFEPDITDL